MKKLLLILLLAAGGWLAWAWLNPEVVESTPDATEIVTVSRGDLVVSAESTATITPENKLEIIPPIAGRAETVNVEIGDNVKQGQVLAVMSSQERAAMLDAARSKGAEEVTFWEDVYKPAPLLAPLDGQIISRTLIPGQVVQSTDVVFILSDHLIAQVAIDETDLAKVSMGQRALITLDSYPNEQLEGEVTKIAYDSTTTNNVTTYSVDVAFAKVPEHARSGMTASVAFIVASRTNVLRLPSDALREGNIVLAVPESGGSPSLVRVETGLTDGKMVEVTAGLHDGQKVLRASYELPKDPTSGGISILPKPGGKDGKNAGPPPP